MKTFIHKPVETPVLLLEGDGGLRKYVLPDGRKYPSVTSFLGELPNEAIIKWKKRMGEGKAKAIAKAAAYRGTLLHGVIEQYLNNEPKLKYPSPFTKELFKKIQPSLDRIDNIRLMEEPIYSDQLRLAGTPDCIAEWDGQLATIDFKGSTREKKESWITRYYCQVAAYSVMFGELFGDEPKQNVVVIVSDNDELPEPQIFVKTQKECLGMLQQYASDLIEYKQKQQVSSGTIH